MPGYSPTENNIVDPVNSTIIPLAPLASFTGSFVDVSGYSSISFACISDVESTFSGIVIEWSTDGLTADIAPQKFTFDPVAVSADGLVVHATIRARFYRITYKNGVFPQTFFILTALLRKGTPAGTVRSIDPKNTFTTNLDVQEVQAILSGVGRANPEQVLLPKMDDVNLPDDGPFVFVAPRPTKSFNVSRGKTSASLTPVIVNDTFVALERATFWSITNNVQRGNLFLRLGTSFDLSITDYDYLIPPGHTYQDSGQFGSVYFGSIYGIWDEVYINDDASIGSALHVVNYYG